MPAQATDASTSTSTRRDGRHGRTRHQPRAALRCWLRRLLPIGASADRHRRNLDLSGSRITARVGIGLLRSGGLGLAAALDLEAPGISPADAAELMEGAHEA